MSTGQIKRYNCVANDHDSVELNDDGEFVKYDDHTKRVAELERKLSSQRDKLNKMFKVVSHFNGGLTPVGCDGMIMLKVEEYNALVDAINTTE